MTDKPKDKRTTALEQIKALAARRSSAGSGPAHTKNTPGGGPRAGSAKHSGGPGHRPQGG